MSGKIYEKEHQIKYYECDTTQKMTLSMLLNIMLHVSGEQSHLLGVGDEVLAEKGLAWIILQYEVKVERMPAFYETITITTQATSYNKLFCYRIFKVYDTKGNLCVTVNSTFALMNVKERKMARVPDEIVAPYEAEFTKKLVRSPKPIKVDEENMISKEYRVRYLDIDSNRHVNNSKYIEWAIDTLNLEFLTTHEIKRMTIKFEKEVHYGQLIHSEMSATKNTDNDMTTAHRIVAEGVTNCEASIEWKTIE
ncbi:acyl-ACP thioesterase [Carnobacterium viridans]|uniref:Medium-chain acyl-[acyl-carrier-protein] hydrolase n=1 Tax=Carnobacterium viridans TaxID=174587 RepID=A0A1H0Z367_9LACT|nr:acyl-ACP thioesterase domain-containing protein [Carnobacterium viridans]UDE94819.1 acyl-ACP thioesterase [Carnobacterium viridans]SDQ21838.1 medium-chain acyl-[acyl-carrier-protein] hydrolase [Carnobacterium viridans]